MPLKRLPGKVHGHAARGNNTMNFTSSVSPSIYRSEAFVEDLDLMVEPAEVPTGNVQRLAAWLLAVPGTVALLASAVVIATLPT